MIRRLRTIDAHVGGQTIRLVVDGLPEPGGESMIEKRAWLRRRADRLRKALLLEPRGHDDMCGALLTEAASAGSDAGLLWMHSGGFGVLSMDAALATATMVVERGLVPTAAAGVVVLDTPAGQVRADVRQGGPSASGRRRRAGARTVGSVAVTGVPSFVLHPGVSIRIGARELRADVAFGGEFYAIVDAEAAGLPLSPGRLDDLREVGMAIRKAVEAARDVRHPERDGLEGLFGTVFTGPAQAGVADLRAVAIGASGQVDRSACASATCAIVAVLDGMGLFGDDRPFQQEGPLGSTLRARIVGRGAVGDVAAVVPEVEGEAWITGEHLFIADDDDPFRSGFRL